MTDATFETLFAGQLREYAQAGVRPIDRFAIAEGTIEIGRRRPRIGRSRSPFVRSGRPLVLVLVGLLVLAIAASVAMVGALWLARDTAPRLLEGQADVAPTPMAISYAGTLQPILPGVDAGLPYPPIAAALPDGRAIFISSIFDRGTAGRPDSMRESNEIRIWDPTTGALVGVGQTAALRSTGTELVPLRDGHVLVVGGDLGPLGQAAGGRYVGELTAEVFDPADGSSVPVGDMIDSRSIFASIRLPDGRVLISGGNKVDGTETVGETLASAEIFDPATGRFTRTGSMREPRAGHWMVPLLDGRVLVVGGPTAEIYDPSTGEFSPTGAPADPRFAAVVPMLDGRVLAFHGHCDEFQPVDRTTHVSEGWAPASSEIYDPATAVFEPGPTLPHCVDTAVALPNGEVFVQGFWRATDPRGGAPDVAASWSGLYDPATDTVRTTEGPDRYHPRTIVLTSGAVLLIGGVGLVQGDDDNLAASWGQLYR